MGIIFFLCCLIIIIISMDEAWPSPTSDSHNKTLWMSPAFKPTPPPSPKSNSPPEIQFPPKAPRDKNHVTSDEENLLSYLFANYNPSARPVLNSSATVSVNLKFSLLQIQELNVRNQILTSTGFLILEWRDERLTWSRGISQMDEVVVKGENIWKPEFAVINGAESIYGEYVEFQATLRSDGFIRWEPGGIFKTMCSIDITFYPFDTQRCEIKFGAWSYQTTKMNLTTDEKNIRIDAYEKNGEWQVMATDAMRNEFAFECCPSQRFSYISFAVELRRRQTFYVMNVIVPGLLTSAVLLSLFYCVPSQKVHIGVAALLSFRLFLVNVADTVPRTSDHIPLLGIYLTCTMAITTLAMVATVLVGNLYERKDRPVPKWLKTLMMDHVARVLCMGRDGQKNISGINTDKSKKKRERSFSWGSWCCMGGRKESQVPVDHLKEDEELQMMTTYDPRSRRTDVKAKRTPMTAAKYEKGRLKDASSSARTSRMSRSKSFDVSSALASIALRHVNDATLHLERQTPDVTLSSGAAKPASRLDPGQVTGSSLAGCLAKSPGIGRRDDDEKQVHEEKKEEVRIDSNKNIECTKLPKVDEDIKDQHHHHHHPIENHNFSDRQIETTGKDASVASAVDSTSVRHRRSPDTRKNPWVMENEEKEVPGRPSEEGSRRVEGPPNYSKDWAHLAAVCDRFFFWLCLFFILGTTLLLFHPLTTSRFFKIPVIDKT